MSSPEAEPPERADHTASNRSTYDRIARRYAGHQQALPSGDAHWLLGLETSFLAGLPPGALVGDLGCGPAFDGERLASKGCRMVGMDISAGMLALASERLGGRVFQADLRDIPVRSGFLDGIWNVASLLHVPDEDTHNVLDEFRRVLKPSGSLLLVTALGASTRREPVAYADEESRWFVYRDQTVLSEQLRRSEFRILTEASLSGSRDWWAVLARST